MSLRSVNLNLLPVLSSLLHERNVSRAAAAVGMSQPAASRALSQLRAILDDPLLVPSGRGLERTARADAMLDTVDRLCREMDALWRPGSFDPGSLKREFVLASADYAPIIMSPPLLPRLMAEAPGVSLRFTDLVPSPTVSVPRGVDFVVVPRLALDAHLSKSGGHAFLFADEFVPVVSAGHPLADAAADRDIDEFPQAIFSAGENPEMPGDLVKLLQGHRTAQVVASVRHFAALPHLVISTMSVAVMPRRLAEVMIGHGLPLVILNGREPRGQVDLCLAWSARFNGDVAHRWFREMMVDVLGGNPPPE